MAEDLNHVVLIGRLTRDTELTHTAGGYPLVRFSIAVNRRGKVGTQWEDEVSYFDLNLWGKRAEALQPYLTKGTQIGVQGQLKQDRWEQDGQKRSKVMIDVTNIQLLGSRSSSTGSYSRNIDSRPSEQAAPPVPRTENQSAPLENHFEDDIPF